MAYIDPNSTIILYKDIGIDNSYENTGYFVSKSAQYDYFTNTLVTSGKTLGVYNNLTYQRVNKGTFRLQAPYGQVYSANYMAFKNSSFENKWFFGFILKAEYINDSCVEFTYELDVLQSWYFETHFGSCFIERQHVLVSDDIAGNHIFDEGLETGEYYDMYIKSAVDPLNTKNYRYAVMCTVTEKDGKIVDSYNSTMIGKYYCGCEVKFFDTASTLENFIRKVGDAGKIDSVISIYQIPLDFTWGEIEKTISIDYKSSLKIGLFEGYTPRNQKLYTAPYCFLYATNLNGNSATYPLEYFSSNEIKFKMKFDFSPSAEAIVYPLNFRGVNSDRVEYLLSTGGYPQCGTNIDTYKAWLAQNAGSMTTSAIASLGQVGLGLGVTVASGFLAPETAGVSMAGAVTGLSMMASGFSSIIGQVGKHYDHEVKPNETAGNLGGTNITRMNAGFIDIFFYMKTIQRQYAMVIDDFFDLFGYKINKLKSSQEVEQAISNRPTWNYIKTSGCIIHGDAPADVCSQIEAIHDKGIRYWKSLDNVGNYSLNNR